MRDQAVLVIAAEGREMADGAALRVIVQHEPNIDCAIRTIAADDCIGNTGGAIVLPNPIRSCQVADVQNFVRPGSYVVDERITGTGLASSIVVPDDQLSHRTMRNAISELS